MILWVASYPKSGNTWVRTFLANLLSNNDQAFDINRLDKVVSNFDNRGAFDSIVGWETADLQLEAVNRMRLDVQDLLSRKGRLFYKVHDAFCHPVSRQPLFSHRATSRAVYIIRNPLDVAVSFGHHMGGDIDQAIKLMGQRTAHLRLNTQLPQPMGDWSWHVQSWTDDPKLRKKILRYEDLLEYPMKSFTEMAQFAGLPDEESRVKRAIKHASFAALQRQEDENGFKETSVKSKRFFREGRAGGWQSVLSGPQVDRIISQHRETMKRFGYSI